ncbi:hypothetical protein IX39_18725 [Chryseobacterium formosense]|uniref:Uncharacterized protein n=1 Tax=Chryseobacterium formosense TaxID=236814 RepID=A0A085Z028_9FLAO|nr:hypothetical protein [Chryseobacterium formosense]KFE97791.1 hypothetical protein IX39_18725 [Chryseobacterium formosense]SFT83515.1 hypothetical protein SAMN05421857_3575 [Chryseobacterium formosense]
MKRNLLNLNYEFENSSFRKSLRFFCICSFLVFISFNQTLRAQVENGNSHNATIVLSQGAVVYSADAEFNKQISSGKITLDNGSVSYDAQKDVLVAGVKQSKNFDNKAKIAESKNQKEELKKIRKKIQDFETRQKSFPVKQLQVFPSQQDIISLSGVNLEYLSPGQQHHDLNKFFISDKLYQDKVAFNQEQRQKITNYSEQAVNFFYANAFSVRPPPVFFTVYYI